MTGIQLEKTLPLCMETEGSSTDNKIRAFDTILSQLNTVHAIQTPFLCRLRILRTYLRFNTILYYLRANSYKANYRHSTA
jgi:hypothetical protein